MEMPIQSSWNKPCPPLSCDEIEYGTRSLRSEQYDVEARFFTLFIGAVQAKNARWSQSKPQAEIKEQAAASLPPENIAAIKLLDSWLNEEVQDHSEEWESIRRTIDENRLSDRNLFSR